MATDKNVKTAKCISVLGTGSDVGKSIVVTALCRIFSDLSASVAPFKAQNMSNNSFVTRLGGEMGRAQIVQAQAARIEPHVDMNPVLLKPSADTRSQVVLHGKAVGNKKAGEYFKDTDYLSREAEMSLKRLRHAYELIIMEGAGSCSEVNLRNSDFVNFRMARIGEAPVILVADIDRGGVFAQIIGTLETISESERESIKGIIINRFRGDPRLFDGGIEYIEKRTKIPVLGLVPFFRHIEIDSEDSLPLETLIDPLEEVEEEKVNIAVLRLPHISNFTDFNFLAREPIVNLHYLAKPRCLDSYSILLLPGTKNARKDMEWLQKTGWEKIIFNYVENGGEVGGICGGYQMLGKGIDDPQGIEGISGKTTGLGLLDVETKIGREKILSHSSGIWDSNGIKVEGYEIHMGITTPSQKLPTAIRITSRNGNSVDGHDGVVNSTGKIWGTYLHGLFDASKFRHAFLKCLRPELKLKFAEETSQCTFKDHQYDMLADHFRTYLDMSKLFDIIGFR